MNKLSIFGSTGFIGSKFCEMYPDNVIKIDRNNYVPKTNNLLYFISTTDNYNVFFNPLIDIETNLIVLIKILQNCKKGDTINFVSSWFVYGDAPLPVTEDSFCDPKGFYSITKRTAEQLLISYCNTMKINYKIFRLGNVIGATDKGVSKKKNALQYLIKEMQYNRDINLYNGGNFTRDYTDVEDICQGINLCINHGKINDIINVASGNAYNFLDLMNYCKKKINSTSNFISIDPPEFHKQIQVKDMCLNIDKLKSFGFIPKYSIYESLDKIIENKYKDK
jgi:nucleoside-diphosphate-sugar epimerase